MPHMKRFGRHGRPSFESERGQGLVEFALVLPLLLIVVLGIVDFGKAYGYKNDMTHLANAAARYASVNSFPTGYSGSDAIKTAVIDTAPAELRNGSSSVAQIQITFTFQETPTSPDTNNHCIGDPVTVTVTSHYTWLNFLSLRGALPTAGSDMKATATMRLEKNYAVSGNAYTADTTSYPLIGTCPP